MWLSIVRICLIIVASCVAFGAKPAAAEDVTLLSLQSGHSIVINAPGLARIAVGDGRIAGVAPIGRAQVVVNGKAQGHTTVFIWTAGRRVTYEVTVSSQTLDDLSQMLRSSIGEPDVNVVSFNHSIVVQGTVADTGRFLRLTDILARFDKVSDREKYTVVDAVTVAHPLGSIQEELAGLPGAHRLRLDPDAKGNVIVSGQVDNRTTAELVLARARGLAGPFLATDGKVIDRLEVASTSQVSVKVYVLEIDRTGLTELGVRLQNGTPDPNNPNHIILGDPSFPLLENASAAFNGRALNIGSFFRTTKLVPTVDMIVRSGHARMLSAPNLVSMPGKEATFLVGGQIPYVVATGLGQSTIDWKDFGVQLKVTPTILGNGGVETLIAPEVSDLDFSDGVAMNGFVVPALKTSKMSTDIITQPGESIIMGGMLRRVEQRTLDKLPLLGDLPILGKLFRSTRYQTSETDVVFVMTPEILVR